MKVVKAAAVQISPVLYSRAATVERVVQKIHELGQQGMHSPPRHKLFFSWTRHYVHIHVLACRSENPCQISPLP